MPKTDPKKVPSQKFVFARTSRYNDPTFYEKKISHITIPLRGHVSFYNKYIYLKTFWVIFITSGMYIMTLVLKTCCRLLLWNIVLYTFPNKAVDYTISKLENSLQFADYGIIYRLYKFLRNFEHLLT